MPTTTIIHAEIRDWWFDKNHSLRGKIYNDITKMFEDGAPFEVPFSIWLNWCHYEKDGYRIVSTFTYNYRCDDDKQAPSKQGLGFPDQTEKGNIIRFGRRN